ncbi:MAG: fasciclin domain-containing protein [Candidatus Nanopelagicales bacterium]
MRLTRTIVAAAAGAALAASALAGVGAAQAAPAKTATPAAVTATTGTAPLAAVALPFSKTWNTNWNDYNVVSHAVFAVLKAKPTSKVGVLANGKVALTAFLPNDRAFQILVKQLTGKTLLREREVFGAVAKLGIPTVEKVLLYHVVPGATITSSMALKSNGANLKTALGPTIHVAVYRGPVISLWDKAREFRNPRVILSQVDINKGNKQIAHGIDRVLLPFQP